MVDSIEGMENGNDRPDSNDPNDCDSYILDDNSTKERAESAE